MSRDALVRKVTKLIREHYVLNAAAADTAEGIMRCWIPQDYNVTLPIVKESLDQLVRSGMVDRQAIPGNYIYRLRSE